MHCSMQGRVPTSERFPRSSSWLVRLTQTPPMMKVRRSLLLLTNSDHKEVITSETLNPRKRFSLGKIGRKSTRHNLISKSDNLVLVPSKPNLERIESLEEEEVEDTEVSRKIISEKSLSFNSLQRDFQLG